MVTEKTEAKRVKSSALPWYITSRVESDKRMGLSEVEQACIALEKDGMPCPMDVDQKSWVTSNFAYICSKYKEKYPKPSFKTKVKLSKNQRKKQKARRRAKKETNVLVSGVDVTSVEFLKTYEWRKVRMEALKKYGAKCQCCGASPANGAVMNVDHIKPRKLFPSLALNINNLQILCHDCNHGKGNWDQTDWR